jgi:RimJ/RimL family protein N-acetyltransferase
MPAEEDGFVDFNCPHCGQPVSFPAQFRGRIQECPACNGELLVPGANDESPRIPLPISTLRCVLRRCGHGDWEDLLEMDPDRGEESILQWLEQDRHVRLTAPDITLYLAIELLSSHKLVGYFSLRFTDSERLQAVVGYEMNQRFLQPDLIVEALDALLGFCFEGIKLHRVATMVDSEDEAACKVCEDAGLRREAQLVKDRKSVDEWRSSNWYALLEEEYLARPES